MLASLCSAVLDSFPLRDAALQEPPAAAHKAGPGGTAKPAKAGHLTDNASEAAQQTNEPAILGPSRPTGDRQAAAPDKPVTAAHPGPHAASSGVIPVSAAAHSACSQVVIQLMCVMGPVPFIVTEPTADLSNTMYGGQCPCSCAGSPPTTDAPEPAPAQLQSSDAPSVLQPSGAADVATPEAQQGSGQQPAGAAAAAAGHATAVPAHASAAGTALQAPPAVPTSPAHAALADAAGVPQPSGPPAWPDAQPTQGSQQSRPAAAGAAASSAAGVASAEAAPHEEPALQLIANRPDAPAVTPTTGDAEPPAGSQPPSTAAAQQEPATGAPAQLCLTGSTAWGPTLRLAAPTTHPGTCHPEFISM